MGPANVKLVLIHVYPLRIDTTITTTLAWGLTHIELKLKHTHTHTQFLYIYIYIYTPSTTLITQYVRI